MIRCLGYIGIRVSDLDAWTTFGTNVLGLMQGPAVDGERRFRTDAQAWRIALAAGGEDDVAYIGLEVAGPSELGAMRRRLGDARIEFREGEPSLLQARGVTGLVSCMDPDQLAVEIYYGPSERTEAPFTSPAGISGFVTGEQGLGHVVLTTRDMGRARTFYQDILGFRLSDIIRMQLGPNFGFDMEFFHCNPRHHTLALVPVPAPKRLHHFMLQVNTLDEVGFALERAEAANVPITSTLGRHTNDHMVSFYARTPSGFEVEFGYGARTVDDASWRIVRHDKPSSWGHKRPPRAVEPIESRTPWISESQVGGRSCAVPAGGAGSTPSARLPGVRSYSSVCIVGELNCRHSSWYSIWRERSSLHSPVRRWARGVNSTSSASSWSRLRPPVRAASRVTC
jgi:2,3-dihydroxybiphenyl 1,2-dioxygenase